MKIYLFSTILTAFSESTQRTSPWTTALAQMMTISVFDISEPGRPTEIQTPIPNDRTPKISHSKKGSVLLLKNYQELQEAKHYYENNIFISTVLPKIASDPLNERLASRSSALTSAETISTLQKLSGAKYGRSEAKYMGFNEKSNLNRVRRFNKFHRRERTPFWISKPLQTLLSQ